MGIAAALFAFGAACTESKEQGQSEPSQSTQTTQQAPTTAGTPTTVASKPPTEVSPLAPGADVGEAELAQFYSSAPDGRGLPPGSGTVMQGKEVYTAKCASCHGAMLEGGVGDKLIGGRGTLAASAGPPVKTVESYQPYATTVWDYIKRAMPFNMPGSLSNDEVYAVTAYILNQAKIVPDDATLSKETLPKVEMPNRNGFREAGR
ncbi:MAG: c-type cytochrome [Acidimicrobiia bacterium]